METTVQIVELGTNCRLQIGDAFVYVTYETLEDIVTKGEQIILNKSNSKLYQLVSRIWERV